MSKYKRLQDEYRFPGCRPKSKLKGIFGDPHARVVVLERRQKKLSHVAAELFTEAITTRKSIGYEIFPVAGNVFIWRWRLGASYVERVV